MRRGRTRLPAGLGLDRACLDSVSRALLVSVSGPAQITTPPAFRPPGGPLSSAVVLVVGEWLDSDNTRLIASLRYTDIADECRRRLTLCLMRNHRRNRTAV
jgi:hypothetical protein